MTKLKRDARAWVHRVKMGKARLWAVVEGKEFDTPYYERLLSESIEGEVRIMRAEDLVVDGVSAGGKSHVKKVFDLFESQGALTQRNNNTRIDVMFFMDRDDDEFLSKLVNNDHVHYTTHADVEAEIVAYADHAEAVSIAFSLPRTLARRIPLADSMSELAQLWEEWITLRIASARAEWSDTRFAQKSGINVPLDGPVDQDRVDAICARVVTACPNWEDIRGEAARHYASKQLSGEAQHLVKGKWMPWLLIRKVRAGVSDPRSLPTVSESYLLGILLANIDFKADWAEKTRIAVRVALAA
ncbi:hypothetical protein [Microbacterium sp. BDGP8]|uniref:hypothetical protein n=1 Tax=Microbacterium sp. BDGP8 TaxID=3035531 RepID=UPI00249EF766|nr:hypothetical protein [Microbacterium sp. BDGP8]WHE36411.1 hypothetical protein P6897_01405 [Microbacterium sp. BDGP8]